MRWLDVCRAVGALALLVCCVVGCGGASDCRGAGCLDIVVAGDVMSPDDAGAGAEDGVAPVPDGADGGGDAAACVPGRRICDGEETVLVCRADGSGYDVAEACHGAATARVCFQGACTRLCDVEAKFPHSVGCEYWAVDLDNAFATCATPSGWCDASAAPYAVVVSNPHPRWQATVTIDAIDPASGAPAPVTLGRGGQPLDLSPLEPGALRVFFLAGGDVQGTRQAPLAFRVSSTIPVTAHQFNPLDNVDVFSNDASLLLPTEALGSYYIAMTREQTHDGLRSYVTVVATAAGETTVTVTVTADTEPATDGSIPHLAPGDAISRVLSQYDVLNIETNAPGDDLTGTVIVANRPVAVFGGSEASNVPNTERCVPVVEAGGAGRGDTEDTESRVCAWDGTTACETSADCADFVTHWADHLEQQLFPVQAWGRQYHATRSTRRGRETDTWRVLAAEDGTEVTTVPPQTSIPPLSRGEWFEFDSDMDFELHATRPVLVGQFLQGQQAPGPGDQPGDAGIGDPAFLLAVPFEQYRPDYVFLVPQYYARDHANVVAPTGAVVTLDGAPIPQAAFDRFGTGAYGVARLDVEDGVHTIGADAPIGVAVYGFDRAVSYGYPGGLSLSALGDAEPR